MCPRRILVSAPGSLTRGLPSVADALAGFTAIKGKLDINGIPVVDMILKVRVLSSSNARSERMIV